VEEGRSERLSPWAAMGLFLVAMASLFLVLGSAYVHLFWKTTNDLDMIVRTHQTTIEHYGSIVLLPVSVPFVAVMTIWIYLALRT
jgi:hypothetical protein